MLTGTPFTAQDALEWGMVNKVVPGAKLMDEVMATARKIASNAPVSARQAKKSLDKAVELDRNSGYAFEIESYNRTVVTQDRQEGINAFNEKRKPKYKVRAYTRCRKCGRPRSVYRKFGLCRVCLRDLAHAGEIPGVTKASW